MSDPTELFLGNAGTAMRPLTAVVCAGKGEFVMDGTPRMRERPIVDLVDGLKQVGFGGGHLCPFFFSRVRRFPGNGMCSWAHGQSLERVCRASSKEKQVTAR